MKFNNVIQNNDKEKNIVEKESKKTENKFSLRNTLEECFKNDVKTLPNTHKKLDGYLSISQIAGASTCMRKQYYLLNKFPKEYKFSFESHCILNVGNLYHDLVQDSLIRNNKIKYVEHFMKCDEYKICGSTDGVLIDDEGNYILNDFKTISLNGFDYIKKTNKPKAEHVAQVHLYHHLFKVQENLDIKKFKITYLIKNQGFHKINLFNTIKMLNSHLSYLENIRSWLISKNQDVISIEIEIDKIKESIKDIESLNEKDESEDYIIKEFDFEFNQKILDQELASVKELTDIIENNKIISEQNKSLPKYKQTALQIPNKTKKTYYCDSCEFLKYCKDRVKEI